MCCACLSALEVIRWRQTRGRQVLAVVAEPVFDGSTRSSRSAAGRGGTIIAVRWGLAGGRFHGWLASLPRMFRYRPPPGFLRTWFAATARQLTAGEDVIDPATWAGSVPHATGIAPRVRVGRSQWFNLLWLLPIGFVLLIVGGGGGEGASW